MVSFLGLKFGSGKKKSDKGKSPEKATGKAPEKTAEKTEAHHGGPKKWDQNLLGEGQFFGTSVGSRSVVNGSIRSVDMSRPPTSSSSRISPYTHNTHALAASSMYDLSNVSHIRGGSANSLKPAASDTNLRGSFSRSASSTSLKVPGPGFGSRPGTPGGRAKAWVNPLDVHFGRTTPSAVPSGPRSPLAQYEFGANTERDDGSVFGDKAENIADSIMSSVAQKEQDKVDKERQEKGKVERDGETKLTDQKAQEGVVKRGEEHHQEQERHRAAAAAAAIRTPHHGPPGYPPGPNPANRPMNGPMDRPVFQGRHDERPSSRNGRHNSPGPMDRAVFQGQGEHRPGSRNGNRPSPPLTQGPMGRGHFQGQMDYRPSSRSEHPDQRPRFQGQMDHQRPSSRNGSHERPPFQGHVEQRPSSRNGPQDRPVFQGHIDQRPSSRNGPRRDGTPPSGYPPHGYQNGHPNGQMNGRPMYGPGPVNGQGPLRGAGPGPANGQFRSPNTGQPSHINGHANSPSPRGSPLIGSTGSLNGVSRSPALNGAPLSGPPSNSSNRPSPAQTTITSPTNGYFPGNLPSPTASSTHSSGDEKDAHAELADRPVIRNVIARRDTITSITPKRASVSQAIDAFEKSLAAEESIRDSTASSAYSVDEIIESPVQPAVLPRSSPTHTTAQPQRSGSAAGGRGLPGRNVQRPSPDEYGVPLPSTGRTTPAAAATTLVPSPPARLLSSSPPSQRLEHASLQPAPLFQQPKWDNNENEEFRHDDFSSPRPAPSPSPKPQADASSVNFGTTPPTPDPTNPNWPLAPPPPTSSLPAAAPPPQLKRANPPPPLSFDFSPNVYSREQGPLLSPPVRTPSQRSPSYDTMRLSPGAAGEVGIARGLSVRGPGHGLQTPTGIADRFGTPLI